MKITLCGSIARHREQFEEWLLKLTIAGHIVHGVSGYKLSDELGEQDKQTLDLVHLAKIEESDAIVILDHDLYIGESVDREIRWAKLRGKEVYCLSGRWIVGQPIQDLKALPVESYKIWSGQKLHAYQEVPAPVPLKPFNPDLDDEIPF